MYRHFRNKQDILETVIVERGESVLAEVRRIVEHASNARQAFDELVLHYAAALVANPSLSAVAVYERRTLSPETRALIERLERLNVEEWVHVLSQVRPELNDGEARVMVHAALGMGVAICNYRSGLDDGSLTELVRSMVESALLRGERAADRTVAGRA